MSDVQSKRFDTVRVGDEVSVLGSYLSVVAIHGDVNDNGAWWITAAQFPPFVHMDTEIRLPRGQWVNVKSKSLMRQLSPTPQEVDVVRVKTPEDEIKYTGYNVIAL